jgi:pyrimidine operon attenuation protein/uracil phosphoribosyltransferase
MNATIILNHNQVQQILKRVAYQVYEQNFEAKSIYIAGISGRGETLAALLEEELQSISKLKTHLLSIHLLKEKPLDGVSITGNPIPPSACLLLVDDVLNTGKTLLYAIKPFLNTIPAKLQTFVLVDRNHRNYPVAADYIGISLSTTLQEHVAVEIEQGKIQVYLK